MFFGCRAVGRHGTGKMAMPNGRHGTVRRPTGRAMGRRPGTKPVEARHGTVGTTARRGKTPIGPARHDVGPWRAGMARWPSIEKRRAQLVVFVSLLASSASSASESGATRLGWFTCSRRFSPAVLVTAFADIGLDSTRCMHGMPM